MRIKKNDIENETPSPPRFKPTPRLTSASEVMELVSFSAVTAAAALEVILGWLSSVKIMMVRINTSKSDHQAGFPYPTLDTRHLERFPYQKQSIHWY